MMTPIRALALATMALDDVARRYQDDGVPDWAQAKALVKQLLEQERLRAMLLDETEYRVLTFVDRYIAQHGYAPKLDEICNHFGWRSRNSARHYLKRLQDKKRVTWKKGCTRSVKVLIT